MLDSVGCLGMVTMSGDTATFGGWSSSFGARPTAHRVFLGERALPIRTAIDNGPTPGVAKLFPSIAGADHCQFHIEAALPPGIDARRPQLFSHEPLFDGEPGRRSFFIVNPDIALPSRSLSRDIGGAYVSVAFEFLGFAYNLLGLKPGDAILDAGCGIGRMAFGLAPYLDAGGRYEGFDIDARMVRWASDNITSRYPQFRFQVADVYNSFYNRKGRATSDRYRFPYEDASFDAATLMSVFTHMDEGGIDNYLRELARVIRRGGRCMVTTFLLDDEVRVAMKGGRARYRFKVPFGRFWSIGRWRPESAVAIEAPMFLDKVREHGFTVERNFPGAWSGRKDALTMQDLLILRR
jgi:SAM-dependent methyltransferase